MNKLNSLKGTDTVIHNVLYNTTLDLLKDKEVREETIEYIINNDPSDKVIYTIADSMLEEPKVKLKK